MTDLHEPEPMDLDETPEPNPLYTPTNLTTIATATTGSNLPLASSGPLMQASFYNPAPHFGFSNVTDLLR